MPITSEQAPNQHLPKSPNVTRNARGAGPKASGMYSYISWETHPRIMSSCETKTQWCQGSGTIFGE